ncbi:FxLD family lantipeptide [Streptomyces sp. NBC_01465]|uniref:FxLD family lantipeptide n=1 Tax=Streptomyces sp. NBC_01465 TaxID=2903878 RepID=UPI002E35C6F2|nr:FxLD family lantipeptide [Streptomyces sp. NBC_01465]
MLEQALLDAPAKTSPDVSSLFNLGAIEITDDRGGLAALSCGTDDGCSASCASSCTSAV